MAVVSLIARISAQIAEFQKSFADVDNSIKGLQTSVSKVNTVLGAFGAALSIGAVVGFVKGVVDAASNVIDLSNKLGISTDAIQKLDFIAGQTGTTIDAFGRAIFTLGNKLSSGDQGAINAVTKLGLSFQQLKTQTPERQFDAVVIALSRVTDVQTRNAIATELWGARVAQEIAKAIAEYEKLGKEAPKATLAQLQAVEKQGDRIDAFLSLLKAQSITAFGTIIGKFEETEKAIGSMGSRFSGLSTLLPGNTTAVLQYADALDKVRVAADAVDMSNVVSEMQRVALQSLKTIGAGAGGPTILTVGTADYKAEEDRLNAAIAKQGKALDGAASKATAYRDAIKQLRDELSGAKLQKDVTDLTKAFTGLSAAQQRNPEVLGRVSEAAERLRREGANLSTQLLQIVLNSRNLTIGLGELEQGWSDLPGSIVPVRDLFGDINLLLPPATLKLEEFFGFMGTGEVFAPWEMLPKQIKEADTGLDELTRSLAQLSQVSGGAFGNIVRDLSTVVASFDTATKGIEAFQAGQKGTGFTGFIGMASGILGIVSAAVSAGKALASLFGFGETAYEKRTKEAARLTEELRVQAIATAGGVDKLRAQFSLVGIVIDEAFKSRDPEWIKKVLDEGYAKTQLLNEAMQEYGFTWENLGVEGRALKLGEAFDVLFAKTEVLKTAGIDYSAILEKQSAQYSELVQKAVRSGTEIPAAYRQVLLDAARLGFLFDEAGNKMSEADVEGLSFAKTLTQGFKGVEDAILRVVDVLERGLGGALTKIGRGVDVPIRFKPEGVSPTNGGVNGGEQTQTINIEIGDAVKTFVIKGMPQELALYGV